MKNIYFHRHTLWDMSIKQLKAKYAGSVLGISWAVITPLLIMLVVTFIFTAVFKVDMNNFHLFVLSGIFPWLFFSNSLSEAASSIVSQQGILHQFNIPRELIPLSSVLSNFLNFLIGWLIFYPLFLFFNPKIILMLPFLIVILILNLIFLCGLSFFLSILNVFYRDISQLLGVLLMFLVWVTPIFYSIDMIPVKFRWICNINPMTAYMVYYREVIFMGTIPSCSIFINTFLWASISLVVGWWFFSCQEFKLLKRV